MNPPGRPPTVLVLIAAVALALAGCSSTGGKRAEEAGDESPRKTVAMVTHSGEGDTFWDLVRSGAEAAAERHNVELKYYSSPQADAQANLVQNAIDQGVDGIALTLAKPDAFKGVLAKAEEADIPVVGLNSGIDRWQDLGLLEYFGSDESLAGTAFGERLNKVGAKKALCVIHEQGNVSLETRCKSMAESFNGSAEPLYVNGEVMPEVRSSITSKLQTDDSIDYVVALGAPVAMTATQSVGEAGTQAKVATFDTNKELVHAIRNGKVEFAVDQQPYLQGYLSVSGLWLYEHNANVSGGGSRPVLTGPDFVDKSNVEEIVKFAERGTR